MRQPSSRPGISGRPWQGLQRHTLETGLLCASTIRLCWVLARSGEPDASLQALGLAALGCLSLLLGYGEKALRLPYALRKSESSGLAEGALAVPSVLAALASAVPQGPWLYWLQATLAAGFAMLAFLQLQGVGQPSKAAHGTKQAAALQALVLAHEHDDQQPARQVGSSERMLPQAALDVYPQAAASVAAAPEPGRAGLSGLLKHHFVACCICMVAVVLLPQQARFMAPSTVSSLLRPQLLASFSPARLSQLLAAARLLLLVAATPAVFHWGMAHMPGCFSVGEGMLLAQGATVTVVAAAGKLRMLPGFVPPALLGASDDAAKAGAGAKAGATTAATAAHGGVQHVREALQLPAFVLLLCGSVFCACWLLWALLHQHTSSSTSSQAATASAGINSSSNGRSSRGGRAITTSRRQLSPGVVLAGVLVVLPTAVIGLLAAWTLLSFLPEVPLRLGALLFWGLALAVSLQLMHVVAHRTQVPQIILRKGYHLLAIALFLPVFWADRPMLVVSLAVAFAALAAVEVARCVQVPGLGAAVQRFMQDFTDERDAGVIYVTHFTLLLGLAVPVWATLALPPAPAQGLPTADSMPQAAATSSAHSAGAWARSTSSSGAAACAEGPMLLSALVGLSGMMAVGVGDTAASVVGRLVGRQPIHNGSKKTLEGTLAGICCTLAAWWLVLGGACGGGIGVLSPQQWFWLVVCTAGAGLLEACTSQLDNIMIPMYYLAHVLLMCAS